VGSKEWNKSSVSVECATRGELLLPLSMEVDAVNSSKLSVDAGIDCCDDKWARLADVGIRDGSLSDGMHCCRMEM
jgi:hypothetical protein